MEAQSKLYIQNLIKDKQIELVSSYMLRYECNNNPFEMRRNTILNFIDQYAASFVDVDRRAEIEAKANEIMKTGVKFKDACHVASAIYAKCEYFISTDIRLLKFDTDEIKMVTPIEFVTETESE